jgi:hypothetical protein
MSRDKHLNLGSVRGPENLGMPDPNEVRLSAAVAFRVEFSTKAQSPNALGIPPHKSRYQDTIPFSCLFPDIARVHSSLR